MTPAPVWSVSCAWKLTMFGNKMQYAHIQDGQWRVSLWMWHSQGSVRKWAAAFKHELSFSLCHLAVSSSNTLSTSTSIKATFTTQPVVYARLVKSQVYLTSRKAKLMNVFIWGVFLIHSYFPWPSFKFSTWCILILKNMFHLRFTGAKRNRSNSAESAALPRRNVCLTKTSICDDSLLNLQRDDSSRRQSCIFQRDTLVNNMPQLSGTVFTAGLCCRPQHNKSSCLEMWTPSFHFGHPQ